MPRFQLSRRTLLAAGSALGVGLAARALADVPDAQDAVIEGNVVYRERMMLPQGARAEVQLVDVSLADAPAMVLGKVEIPDVRSSPIRYALSYDPNLLEGGHRYAVQARISLGDDLLFINDVHHAFEPGQSQVEILVKRVAAQTQTETLGLVGSWLVEDIEGGGVIDNAQTTLEIAEDGAVSGSGGCNRYSGSAEISDTSIRFGALATTQMACAEALMDQERKFYQALEKVVSFRIVQEERKLLLLDADGAEVVRLAAN